MTKLCDLARKWTTDKALYYAPVYDSFFKDRRDAVRKVLEIGIGYPDLMLDPVSRIGSRYYIAGASLFMWEEYFPNAQIYALDINERILINSGRIHSFKFDQGDEYRYAEAIANVGRNFDLIIDDGSHIPEHQLLAAKMLVPCLAPGGIYVIEDAPPGDDHFLEKVPFRSEVFDFSTNGEDPARLVVIRK